jgi:hypothetical protein
MKQETKKTVVKVIIVVAVILGLMLTAHILVNYFNIVQVIKALHGG